jgi:hypothetical protein
VATTKCRTTNFFSPFSFVAVFGSGIRDTRSWIRDKNQDPGYGLNNPDLQHWFWVPVPYLVVVFTEYTELQPLLSGVHLVMRVKLALAGEGGGCTPTPFYYIYHHQ